MKFFSMGWFSRLFGNKRKEYLPLNKLFELAISLEGVDKDLLYSNISNSLDKLEEEYSKTESFKTVIERLDNDKRNFSKEQIEGMIEVLESKL